MPSLASYLPPALDVQATRLAGQAIGGRGLTAIMAIFLKRPFRFGLPGQNSRQLFAQGLDFCSPGGIFGLQVGDAFCSVHAPILPACATPPE